MRCITTVRLVVLAVIASSSVVFSGGDACAAPSGEGVDAARRARALQLFSVSPALFAENQGQWADPSVRFVHKGNGANVAMTDSGPVFQVFQRTESSSSSNASPRPPTNHNKWTRAGGFRGLGSPAADSLSLPLPGGADRLYERDDNVTTRSCTFSASFVGANKVRPIGLQRAETIFNYHVGDDPARWRSGVPSFEVVAYQGLYDGIDLYAWGRRSHLKYEFHVAPGADWRKIRVRYEGIAGLSIKEDGSLRVGLGEGWGSLIDDAPYIYQEIAGKRVEVAGCFALVDDYTYTFQITGEYDPARPLIIDPDLAWSSYLGGGASDYGNGIAVDASGVYVTGRTESSGWTSGGFDTTFNGGWEDAFVAKLTHSGEHLWSTYLGGGSDDYGYGIAVDASGVYVTGSTYSSGWTSGGFDTSYNGYRDAFVAKLTPSGEHLWSTYLGRSSPDYGFGIAVDASGVYVTGLTNSSGWTSGGFDTTYNGGYADAFVAKLTPSGGHVWSTYLGGSDNDLGCGIAVDGSGVYVTGHTKSSGWTSGGFDTNYNGNLDAFVAKLTHSGGHAWSTYLGGNGTDYGYGIAVDASGVYVTGSTESSGWTSGGFDTTHNGSKDAFVAKLTPSGGHLWSTYLGGSDYDWGRGIAVDASGVYVTGKTESSGWTSGGFDTSYNGGADAFVARITVASADHGDTIGSAFSLGSASTGGTLASDGQIGNGSYGAKDVDFYRFRLNQGGTVEIDIDARSIGSSLDGMLRLFDSSGSQLAANDDQDGLDPFISTVLSAGTYYVGVSGYSNSSYSPFRAGSGSSGSTGSYLLSVRLTGSGPEVPGALKIAGMDFYVDQSEVIGSTVRLRGRLILPDSLGGLPVPISGSDYIDRAADGTLSFSRSTMAVGGVPASLVGLFFQSGFTLHLSTDEVAIEGELDLSIFQVPPVDIELRITDNGAGGSSVDIIGGLFIPGPIYLGPGFSLEDIALSIDMSTNAVRGDGTLYLPAGFGISVGVGIQNGYLDYVWAGVTNLNQTLIAVYGIPVVVLQDVGASVDHLAPGPPAVVLAGRMVFTAGPQIHIGGQDYYLLRLDLEAEYDTRGRFTGTGEVTLGGGNNPFRLAAAEVIIDKDYGLYVAGDLSLLGVLDMSGALRLALDNSVQGSLEGSLSLIGIELASAKGYVQYINDDDYENDYVYAGAKVLFGVIKHAIKIDLNTGEINWWASYEKLDEIEVPRPPDSGAPLIMAGPYAFDLPTGLEGALFSIEWEEGNTDIHLTDPLGVTYTPENAGDDDNIEYAKDPDRRQGAFGIANPPGGTWLVTVTNPNGIGGYRIEMRGSTNAAVIAVLQPQADIPGGQVTISWVDEDSDSDAQIGLYYDTNREGANGILITDRISEDDETDSYTWDTSGVPTGSYYIYAVINDGTNVPAISYSTGRVLISAQGAPAPPTDLNAPEGSATSVMLTWVPPQEEVDHYIVRITPDAAGEGYGYEVTASGAEMLVTDLLEGETYRITVAAVGLGGQMSADAEPIIVVPGGQRTLPPESGEWEVFARRGATYQAEVAAEAGAQFNVVSDLPWATVDANGIFTWPVPSAEPEGWKDIAIYVRQPNGETDVYRYSLLVDPAPPIMRGDPSAESESVSTIRVRAADAEDVSGVLRYELEREGVELGNWQTSTVFADTGLQPNTIYEYRVRARDASPDQRTSVWTNTVSACTLAAVPVEPVLTSQSDSEVVLSSLPPDGNPAGTEYAVKNATTGKHVSSDGGESEQPAWQTADEWAGTVVTGLLLNTEYQFQVTARNANGVQTEAGPAAAVRTARETVPPTVVSAIVHYSSGDIQLEFSEPVLLSIKDVTVRDNSGGPIDLSEATLVHGQGESVAALSWPDSLPSGRYTLILNAANVQDLSANLLDGNGDGTGGDDYSLKFHRLPGDVNGDCVVNILDMLDVRNRLREEPASADNWKADINGDGAINILDMIVVRNNLNATCGE